MAGENEYDVYDEARTAASPKYFGASRRALATTSAAPAPSTPRRERTIQGIAAASPSLSVRTAIGPTISLSAVSARLGIVR